MRARTTNDFEKDFFKLLNNSVFGETMENIKNRVDIRLVCDEKASIKLAAKPNYDGSIIFDESLVAVHTWRTRLFYNKPIYLGMCILDLSRALCNNVMYITLCNVMYDNHYNYVKNKWGKMQRYCLGIRIC